MENFTSHRLKNPEILLVLLIGPLLMYCKTILRVCVIGSWDSFSNPNLQIFVLSFEKLKKKTNFLLFQRASFSQLKKKKKYYMLYFVNLMNIGQKNS